MLDEDTTQVVHVSALNQYAYCSRRCAIIYVEQIFEDNVYTMRGRNLHERTDDPRASECENKVRVERGLPIWNRRLGLVGKADAVEFHDSSPYPVEYKSGPRKQYGNDDLQLCAQAMCLEEMTGQIVSRGAIFHHKSRRRREVIFTPDLRKQVEETVAAIRALLASKRLPLPVNDRRCEKCSLKEACMPQVLEEPSREKRLLGNLFDVANL